MELKKHESIDVHCFLFSLSQHVKVRPLIMCKDQNIEGHALATQRLACSKIINFVVNKDLLYMLIKKKKKKRRRRIC